MGSSEPWSAPTLVSDRVTLRPVAVDDADAMWEMVNDTEGRDLTGTVDTFELEQIREWCRTRGGQAERVDLAIVDNATGEYAGEAVLNEFDAARGSANFRISLRGPAWYGRGLGSEATALVVAHGLGTVGLRRITLTVLARNGRAIRSYEKAGFRRTDERDEDGERWVHMEITSAR